MYDIVLRYLARAFVTGQPLVPSADTFSRVAAALGKNEYLPLPFEELGPGGRNQRIGLRSADGTRTVMLRGESIDLEYHQPVAAHAIAFDAFHLEAADILSKALAHLAVRAHRLAVIQEGLLPAMSAADMQAVASRLLNVPEALGAPADLFEWDWRTAAHVDRTFGSLKERTNTIAIVRRVSGTFGDGPPFDRLFVSTDVNTSPEYKTPRLGEHEARAFCAAAPGWHDALAAGVLKLCGIGHDS